MGLGRQSIADALDLLVASVPSLYAVPWSSDAGADGQTGTAATNATALAVPYASWAAATVATPSELTNTAALLWPAQSGALTCGHVAFWKHETNRTAADYFGTAVVESGGSPTTVAVPDGYQLRFLPGELILRGTGA